MRFKYPFKSSRKALFLFPLAFACIALFPMFGKGMFMDGILYAIISKNVAQDVCGIWSLKITDSLYPHFNEHPPLVFALQSGFFEFFGDKYWVERVYSLTTVLISAWLIYLIYQQLIALLKLVVTSNQLGNSLSSKTPDTHSDFNNLNPVITSKHANPSLAPSAAWVLLLWISIPVVNRCAQNNMLENTMLVFVLASVWAYFKSLLITTEPPSLPIKHVKKPFFWQFVSGCMLYLAFMAKGFTGLFPFSLPFIYFWTNRLAKNHSIFQSSAIQQTPEKLVTPNQISQSSNRFGVSKSAIINMMAETFFMVAGFVLSFALMIWAFPESLDALLRYFQKQVVGSLEQVQTVSTRFKILGDYLLALLPMLLMSLFLGWYFNRSRKEVARNTVHTQNSIGVKIKSFMQSLNHPNEKASMVYVLILLSLSGVLPIMISLKQSDYYIYCVFPFTAMAVVIGFKNYWLALENRLLVSKKWQPALLIVCFVFGGWGFAQAGKIQRDQELWNDVNSIVSTLNQKEGDNALVLGSFRALKDDWYMQAYLYRYFNITVQNYRVPNDAEKFKYYLVPKNYIRDSLNGLTPLNMQLKKYELWQKKR